MAYGSSQARGQLKLQQPAYPTATAVPDPSHICDLHHSSGQHQILNLLSEARDRTVSLWILVGFITTEPWHRNSKNQVLCSRKSYCLSVCFRNVIVLIGPLFIATKRIRSSFKEVGILLRTPGSLLMDYREVWGSWAFGAGRQSEQTNKPKTHNPWCIWVWVTNGTAPTCVARQFPEK